MIRTRGTRLLQPASGLPLQQLLDVAAAALSEPYSVQGDAQVLVQSLAPLHSATRGALSFCRSAALSRVLQTSQASVLITTAEVAALAPASTTCLITAQPYLLYARFSLWWQAQSPAFLPLATGHIHPSAVVDPGAQVHPTAIIGPLCVVEAGAKIGARTRLYAQVRVAYDCVIGADCILQSGVVIGSDGFGNVNTQGLSAGEWVAIAQLGAVRIGDRVAIGANSCVDRGALEDTVIEDGVKIDNQVHIAHNVHIGRNSALAGQVGIAGSARIGAQCTLGGDSKVVGHVVLGDHVHISGATVVTKSLPKAGLYTGIYPIDEHQHWEKNAALLRQLSKLRERVRNLERAHAHASALGSSGADHHFL